MNQTTTRNSALIKLVSFVMMLSIALYFGAAVAYASDLDLEPSSGNGGFSSRGLSAVDALALETLSADGGKIVQVSLNVDYSSALKSDGSLWMWGLNDHGQLGDGTTTERHVPVKVLDGVTEVSLGSYYTTAGRSEESVCTSAAIKADGSLWMWGYNGDGQVGDGSTEDRLTPVKVLDGVAQVDLHYRCSAAIKTDGSLWTWGSNGYGQLGDGTTIDRHSPVKVMDGVAQVSIGYGSAVIKTDGSLWTWGYNGDGQVGDGSTEDRLTPVKVMEDVSQVCLESSSPLSNHYAVVKTDGSLWTWGSNEYGELGDGTTSSRYTPVKVMEGVARVSLGDNRSSALKSDGSFWTWGSNGYGYLGDGTTEDRLTPVKIMENVVWASTTSSRSAALKSDGSLWAWGDNRYGQVGDGMAEWRYEPVKVMEGVAQVSLGLYSCAAIKSDGSLWTWGANYEGYLGDGTTTNRLAPVCIFRGGEWLYGSSSATQPATDPTPDPIQPRVDGSTSKKSIEKASVSVAKATYDGTAKKPKVTVSLGGKALKVGTDYKVTYSNNVNASSKAVAKVTGINKYKGSVSKKFKIAKHPMDKAVTATFPKSEYAWTGKAIKPEPKVCFNGKKMKKGTDYKINYYLDNKNVGHASVMVSGKGNFENKGRLFGFDIVKAQQPIKLDKGSLCFRYRDIGKTVTMAVSGVKEKASVNVTSSKTKVATVKKSGGKYVITLKGVGTAKITAETTKATKHYAKTTKTIEFTVVDDRKDPKLTVAKAAYELALRSGPFNLDAKKEGDGAISYKMSKADAGKKVVTVDSNGKVTLAGKAGTVAVKVSVSGTTKYKPAERSVEISVALVSLSDPSVYMTQWLGSDNCTFYALANMMRRKAILDLRSDWKDIGKGIEDPESAFAKACWTEGVGLNSPIEYKFAKKCTFKAEAKSFLTKNEKGAKPALTAKQKAALVKDRLIKLLKAHPEGIECYDTGIKTKKSWIVMPHAVLVTSYDAEKDTFHCVDSGLATEYYKNGKPKGSKGIIKLANSLLGQREDRNQAKVLATLDKYWYLMK